MTRGAVVSKGCRTVRRWSLRRQIDHQDRGDRGRCRSKARAGNDAESDMHHRRPLEIELSTNLECPTQQDTGWSKELIRSGRRERGIERGDEVVVGRVVEIGIASEH